MEQIHKGQGAQQGDDDRHGRDQGGAAVPQKQKHDDDDEHGRDGQGAFDVDQRGAGGDGAVNRQLDIDLRRQFGAQHRQRFLDAVDRLNDVGARLLGNADDDGFLAVGEAEVFIAFRAVIYIGDVGQAHA